MTIIIKNLSNHYMKKLLLFLFLFLTAVADVMAQHRTTPLYVDGHGVWRRASDNQEVSYYGTNYTLPFAHSYRAAGYLGVDRKKAIDMDVYHIHRMGLNAFRLHLWDVEISDEEGNLLENDHLDLLDYLLMRLESYGIDIILTAQTNFGNGYPERDIRTPGYTYLYDKCDVHSNPAAVRAQKRYVSLLVNHKNKYTNTTYSQDPHIVALEINNEPCHAVSVADTRNYINAMVKTLRASGFRKTILYNMSHNHDFVEAYLQAGGVDGGTFQWYPTGLVSGKTLSHNFLPYVDEYKIDFASDARFAKKCKVIYEFDPGDIAASYLYPAVARSFRSAGFQWATQFAYDAAFLAPYNTDYQTHYLNLIYTPGKAVGMMIAAHVMSTVPMYQQFPKYPADTVFGNVTVSYSRDLAVLDDGARFFHTNNCDISPRDPGSLKSVCGVGSSPIVSTNGNGVYFIERQSDNSWKLELMPSILEVSDPFGKPSLSRKVRIVTSGDGGNRIRIRINLPGIGDHEYLLQPGAYILRDGRAVADPDAIYYKVSRDVDRQYLVHHPADNHAGAAPLDIQAVVASCSRVDSLVLYPSYVSFWNRSNPRLRLQEDSSAISGTQKFRGAVPSGWMRGNSFGYYLLAYSGGKCVTYPSGREGDPLDWDSDDRDCYRTRILHGDKFPLIASAFHDHDISLVCHQDWQRVGMARKESMPDSANCLMVFGQKGSTPATAVLTRDLKVDGLAAGDYLRKFTSLCVAFSPMPVDVRLRIGFVCNDGITYLAQCDAKKGDTFINIPLRNLQPAPTFFQHDVYPSFLPQEFVPDGRNGFDVSQIDCFQIVTDFGKDGFSYGLIGAWLR